MRPHGPIVTARAERAGGAYALTYRLPPMFLQGFPDEVDGAALAGAGEDPRDRRLQTEGLVADGELDSDE